VLRNVHCVDETNPESGDDDIVVAGILVDGSGHLYPAKTIVSCQFDDGTYCNHGNYVFGTYDLGATASYPKSFWCILQLVEIDSDEAEAVTIISDIMKMTCESVEGQAFSSDQLISIMTIYGELFFDDDIFTPYPIGITLNNANEYGSDKKSDNWHTGNISGHGGTYRVGFYNKIR
jgi:hypothetical protein